MPLAGRDFSKCTSVTQATWCDVDLEKKLWYEIKFEACTSYDDIAHLIVSYDGSQHTRIKHHQYASLVCTAGMVNNDTKQESITFGFSTSVTLITGRPRTTVLEP